MKRNIKASLILLGVVSIIGAVLGLLYNISTLWASSSGAFEKLISEALYFFSLGFVGWHLKGASLSIAAASGVANGGLMAQFIILLPLWGIVLTLWVRKKIQNAKNEIKTI